MPKPRRGSVTWSKKRKAWIARLDWQDADGRKHKVYRLAAEWGIPARSVRRAKRWQKIKSVKRGGLQHGYGAVWYWELPEINLP
jgi:hypothetical protein